MGLFGAAKKAVVSSVQRLIDDMVTKQLQPYLATGEVEGEVRSDVVVDENNDISVVNCVLKPSMVDALLTENELPFHVLSASCTHIHIDIPWEALTTGDWVLTVEGLAVVVAPKERKAWSLADVRALQEATIEKLHARLRKRFKEITEKAARQTLFQSLARKFTANLKPTIQLKDVHLRFERLGRDAPVPFACGFVMASMNVSSAADDEGQQQTQIRASHVGVYCRTLITGERSVLPEGYDPEAFACEAEPTFIQTARRKERASKERAADAAASSDATSSSAVGAAAADKRRPVTTRGSLAVAELAEHANQTMALVRFFKKHDTVKAHMAAFVTSAAEWTSREWLLGPLHINHGDASVHVQQAHKADPDKFDYAAPISVTTVRLPSVIVDATNDQLAAFLSLTTFRQEYRLWAAYATRRLELASVGRPRRADGSARRYWQVAKQAVTAALHKARVNASNLATMLEDASRYRRGFVHVIAAVTNPEAAADVRAARERLALSQPALVQMLQELEDTLPAETLAWCRFQALQKVRDGAGRTRKAKATEPPRGSVPRGRYSIVRALGRGRATSSTVAVTPLASSQGAASLSTSRHQDDDVLMSASAAGGEASVLVSNVMVGGGQDERSIQLADDVTIVKEMLEKADAAAAPATSRAGDALAAALGDLRGGSSEDDDLAEGGDTPTELPVLERFSSHDDELANTILERKRADDARIDAAPAGYVHHVVVLHLDAFVLRLLHAPAAEEAADALGRAADERTEGLLTLRVHGIDVRMRTMQTVGKSVHLAIGSVEISEGFRRGGSAGGSGMPIVFRIDGDDLGETPDHHLGGTSDHPGDILTFLEERGEAQPNSITAAVVGFFGGAAKEPRRDRRRTTPRAAEVCAEDDALVGGGGGGGAAAASATAAVEPPADDPLQLGTLHLRQGPPAVRVFMLSSARAARPHECHVTLGRMEAHYSPAFFSRYDVFMRTLERVKHSSHLGGSVLMRTRFAKLTRSVGSVLAEKWHTLEAKMMTVFLSMTDLFDQPSARHALNVSLGGVALHLHSEKDVAEELMNVTLPPMHIARTPREGEPRPPLQKAEITFGGKLEVSTPVAKKVLARALQAQHAGTHGHARMGGRLLSAVYTATDAVAGYRERLRHLDKESDELRLLLGGLRAREAASVLHPAVDDLAPRPHGVDLRNLLERERLETGMRYQQLYSEEAAARERLFAGYVEKLDTATTRMNEQLAALAARPKTPNRISQATGMMQRASEILEGSMRRTASLSPATPLWRPSQWRAVGEASVGEPQPRADDAREEKATVDSSSKSGCCHGWLRAGGGARNSKVVVVEAATPAYDLELISATSEPQRRSVKQRHQPVTFATMQRA